MVMSPNGWCNKNLNPVKCNQRGSRTFVTHQGWTATTASPNKSPSLEA